MGATSTSLEVYLASHPRPGVDYVDGVLEERNVGENDHSWLQFEIGRLLYQAGFHIVRPGLRLYIRLDRYRVPDVCIFQEPPTEQVPTKPPLLAAAATGALAHPAIPALRVALTDLGF